MLVEFALILLLLVANGVFSAAEIAIVSARKLRLARLARQGSRTAEQALRLAEEPEDFLSAVQVGITLIGILSGTIGGAAFADPLRHLLERLPLPGGYAQPLSIVLVVAVITYLSLVIGELAPKRIALGNPEALACRVSPLMATLARVSAPLVRLLSGSTALLLKLFGVEGDRNDTLTEEEIHGLLEQGTQAGVLEVSEQEMMSRILRLGDQPVRALMVPRTELAWLDVTEPLEDIRSQVLDSPYSRFPVCQDGPEQCLGILRVKDLLRLEQVAGTPDLLPHLSPPLYVGESTRAFALLEQFKAGDQHLALVTDEFGSVVGLITLNDLVEGIVGELPNEQEEHEPSVIRRSDGSFLLDGLLTLDELTDLLGETALENARQQGRFQTLGGLVMHELGSIPRSGDTFTLADWRLEVVDMDGLRVDKVLVMPQPPSSEPPT